ncbi:MAG: 4Fe-4S dicluster domain-containing protein [candidate division Zixibacteria bacterium]|nr:4Fe-4S dicluster domain-containing protein [candidate division Zixibacteria bacterium]
MLQSDQLKNLFVLLKKKGYDIIGPTVRDRAVVLDSLADPEDLPVGYRDRHAPGMYRLENVNDDTCFSYVVGLESWKKYLYPAYQKLLTVQRTKTAFTVEPVENKPKKFAALGMRPCELKALAIQDTVFTGGEIKDTGYMNRRHDVFIVAVNCTTPGSNCFCTSMKTGPKADAGYDLALTEVKDGNEHYFVTETGSPAGADIVTALKLKQAGDDAIKLAQKKLFEASASMESKLDTVELKAALEKNFDNPDWETIASRCLACGNCTMVCPTCFCTTMQDDTALDGSSAGRLRLWDSCHNIEFSYIHGGSIRNSGMSRYRQWVMHKLAYWVDQFGTFGCVGCGRCITWCPVGIDITATARQITGPKTS